MAKKGRIATIEQDKRKIRSQGKQNNQKKKERYCKALYLILPPALIEHHMHDNAGETHTAEEEQKGNAE